MKTKKSRFLSSTVVYLLSLCVCPLLAPGQTTEPTKQESAENVANTRPKQSDTASRQLIENYLKVTGGTAAHLKLQNVVAEGTIKESTLLRNFKLIETRDGKRHLTYHWTHLGRPHRVVYVYDGISTWTQVLEPKKKEPHGYGGADAIHFANQHWLLQPFTLPQLANYVFKYQGGAKVSGRSTHLIKGWGKKNIPSWFYFDKEKFLLTRWGGEGQIAGTKENLDYRASQFKSVNGVLLPSKIDLLAENAAFGHIEFKKIQANQNLNDFSFLMPQSKIPTLRQRPVQTN